MRSFQFAYTVLAFAGTASCTATTRQRAGDTPMPQMASGGALAQIYYWRAKPGKFEEYSRYIRESAEPIDHAAQRRGAFLSVTTYVAHDTASAWTHMRVFVLRDSAQLRGLSAALDSAGIRLEPDSTKRRVRSAYSATLRDRVGAVTAEVFR